MTWFTNNLERPTDDALYGAGHRPRARWEGGWWPACACSMACTRADDHRETARPYHSADDARDAAARNLAENEHGPTAGQEQTT